jgi:hypothetical protein
MSFAVCATIALTCMARVPQGELSARPAIIEAGFPDPGG